jgi:hypothetical protein
VSVPGTSVSVEDTERGVALVFVTTGDVEAVRGRVAEMAGMHNDHHGKMGALPTGDEASPAGHDHTARGGEHAHGGGHVGHAGGMIGVHSRAEVERVEGGARLVLISAPADQAKLREELTMHARHLASGRCTMEPGA